MSNTNFKQTEVGLIPSDWEVKTIGEIFTFYSTSNFSKAEMTLDGEVGCVHYGLIHAIDNTSISLKNGVKYYVAKEQAKYESLQNGDVVMVDASEDLIGLNKSVEVSGISNKEFIAGLHTFHLRDKNSIYISSFRGVILNSDVVKKQMLRVAVGMKVFGVSKPQLRQILVPVPRIEEQTAIATALSDADTLISSLEKLIAKKRMIKQGAMQQLLASTGSDGKPKEGWEVKRLGEIAEVRDGTHQTPTYVESGIPFYSVESVTNNDFKNTKFITEEAHKLLTKTCKIEKDDILMTRIGSIGDCKLVDWDVNASFYVSLALLKIKSGYSSEYIYHFSKTAYFKKEADVNSLQSAIPKKINLGPISNIKIRLPSYAEQTRIATILSDMDAEIAALEAKLEKYRKVKMGMMQNLLTGKIRLV